MKLNFEKIILPGLTGEKLDDLLLKIKEADDFKIKEASLFLEFFEKTDREKHRARLCLRPI